MIRNHEYLETRPNTLCDAEGARKGYRRVGRGPGSTKGKTCGRGHNGQKSRPGTGKMNVSFIGGQNPLNKRLPKKGFNARPNQKPLEKTNVHNLLYFIRKGRLDASKPITMKDMFEAGVFTEITYGVKILGRGAELIEQLDTPLHLEITDASQSVIDAVKAKGGSITSVYHTKTTLRRYLQPHLYLLPEAKIPMPKPRQMHKLETFKNKGLEVRHPPAPWFEDYKAGKQKDLEEFDSREKNDGEKTLPKYPADRSPGVSLHKPKYEKEEIQRNIKYNIPH